MNNNEEVKDITYYQKENERLQETVGKCFITCKQKSLKLTNCETTKDAA